jgi:hypothetical protein
MGRLNRYIGSGCKHHMWKKITWTVRSSLWFGFSRATLAANFDFVAYLLSIKLPPSCEEVNLELECLDDDAERKTFLGSHAEKCRKVALRRRGCGESRDDETLRFDEAGSKEYKWKGMMNDHWREDPEASTWATYYVIRLCWRSEVPKREYMHLDRLDCLTSNLMRSVERKST